MAIRIFLNTRGLINCYEDAFPEWSELDFVEIIKINRGEAQRVKRRSTKEMVFIGNGECECVQNGNAYIDTKGSYFELQQNDIEIINSSIESNIIIHIGGNWSKVKGTCGVFSMNNSLVPKNSGDPTDYTRKTDFDNHYHDCDEYWIIFKGSGLVVSEGIKYNLKPGVILATRKGDHHDFVEVFEEIHGVWFETSLTGKKRLGHLWEHTHGKAETSNRGVS